MPAAERAVLYPPIRLARSTPNRSSRRFATASTGARAASPIDFAQNSDARDCYKSKKVNQA
jgi:hypothetical protein